MKRKTLVFCQPWSSRRPDPEWETVYILQLLLFFNQQFDVGGLVTAVEFDVGEDGTVQENLALVMKKVCLLGGH